MRVARIAFGAGVLLMSAAPVFSQPVPVDAGSIVSLPDGPRGRGVAVPPAASEAQLAEPFIIASRDEPGGTIVVSGNVPSQRVIAARDGLDIGALSYDSGSALGFSGFAAFAIALLEELDSGRASLRANILTIEGIAPDAAAGERISALLAEPPRGLVLATALIDVAEAPEPAEQADGEGDEDIAAEPEVQEPEAAQADDVDSGEVEQAESEQEEPEQAEPAQTEPVQAEAAPEPSATCREVLAEFSSRNSILFNSGSATISAESSAALTELAQDIIACGDVPIYIEGHTDSDGDDGRNLILSVERAEAVVAAMVSLGIDPARLYAVGYGESEPIADNATQEGKRQNRRIVILAEDRYANP